MENSFSARTAPAQAGTFFKGARTGAFNSAMLMGIFAFGTVAYNFAAPLMVAGAATLPFMGIPVVALTLIATGVFGGVMAVKRSLSHEATMMPVPFGASVTAQTPTVGHVMQMQPQMDGAQEQASEAASNWTDRISTGKDSQSRIQQIIADGSLSDKERAGAILSARENAAGTERSV